MKIRENLISRWSSYDEICESILCTAHINLRKRHVTIISLQTTTIN